MINDLCKTVVLFVFLAGDLQAQTVLDLFYALPDKAVWNTPVAARKQMVAKKVILVDLNNGFLSWTVEAPPLTEGGSTEFQICYWNESDKTKLIATNQIRYEWFTNGTIEFWSYNRGKFTAVPTTQVLPQIAATDFKADAATTDVFELSFSLPRVGKNITAMADGDIQGSFLLVWQDGKFAKGEKVMK